MEALIKLLRGKRVVALTGAGMSTESGIPDYRGQGSRPRRSIQGPEFRRSRAVRARYWARSVIGWEKFSEAMPNAGHIALARLEEAQVVRAVITQNVDRLHHSAGTKNIVELHGSITEVSCLSGDLCGHIDDRAFVQERITRDNREIIAAIHERSASLAAPDGDADLELTEAELAEFQPPVCEACGQEQRPHVVLFGENVPQSRVATAFTHVDAADVLLVLGTSLAVYSGYRFLRHAVARSIPVAIVNLGSVRCEESAAIVVEHRTGDVLPGLARYLT